MSQKIDVLIAGGGLAGCLLAWRLSKTGRSVIVCDSGAPGAWQVAGGLAAPVSGQRATLFPDATKVLTQARQTYTELANDLGQNFWTDREILRIFSSADEAQRWHDRADEPAFQPFLEKTDPASLPESRFLKINHGVMRVKQAGQLQVAALVTSLRAWLRERGQWREQIVNANELQVSAANIQWQDLSASSLVFCEGALGRHNSYFPEITFQPTRGELLEIDAPALTSDRVLYGEHFLLPLGGTRWLCGATYDRADLEAGATEAGREQLTQSLARLLAVDFKVVGQRAGVRPNVLGHQPMCRAHGEHRNLFVLNGLGSKGALWGPWFAKQMDGLMKENI